MDLDMFLEEEEKLALEMNIFPRTEEAKKGEKEKFYDRYPDLDDSQFADPEHRRFPIDTPEHCRAAMVYLNKYYNNPSKGGVTKTYSEEDFKRVHDRIVKAMKKFGIEHDGCSICKKEGKASEEPEQVEEIEKKEVASEVSEEMKESEEQKETTEEVVSEETSSESEASVEESKEEASEDSESEESSESELKVAYESLRKEFDEIKANLDIAIWLFNEATYQLKQYQIYELGIARLSELKESGIIFEDADNEARILKLGQMVEEAYNEYKEDLLKVKKLSETKEEAKASISEIQYPSILRVDYEDGQIKSKKEEFKELYK